MFLLEIRKSLLPLGLRQAGILNDAIQFADMEPYPLNHITVPTLVIHAVDDKLVPFAYGQFSTKVIPTAQLFTLNSGGHLLVGHSAKLASAITAFVPT